MLQPKPYAPMDAATGDDCAFEDDWVIVDKNWWHTPISSFTGVFFTFSHHSHDPSTDPDCQLSVHLPGVRFAEQVLRFYESTVGFDCSSSLPPSPAFSLAFPALPPTLSSEELDEVNKAIWSELVSSMEEDDDLVSPSMSSSVMTHRSTSVDLASDSGRSAIYSSMPSTPRATDNHVFVKELASPSEPDPLASLSVLSPPEAPSPILAFQFPSLNSPVAEITRDEDGFIVPPTDQTDSLLPAFLLDASPKSKAASRSKTRTIVDKLRSSSRDPADDECDDSSTPSIHDLSFIKPRLGVSSDVDDDDAGWIGSPMNTDSSTSSTSDSLMARANRARTLFLALRKSKALTSSITLSKGKGKAKSMDDPRLRSSSSSSMTRSAPGLIQDKDGWIEYPSLNGNKARLSSTKDTMHNYIPSRSKKANTITLLPQGPLNNHRRTASHHPIPLSLTHFGTPSTSGTFVFPPRPPMPPPPLHPQWNGTPAVPMPIPPAPPQLQLFQPPPPPPGHFFHQRAPSMPPAPLMRPPGHGQWIVPTPTNTTMGPPPVHTFQHIQHRKPSSQQQHVIA